MEERIEARAERFLGSEQGKLWLDKFCRHGGALPDLESEFAERFRLFGQESREAVGDEEIALALALAHAWKKVYCRAAGDPAAPGDFDEMALRQAITRSYPRPIALAYSRLANEADTPAEQFHALLDTAEAISHCLCSLVMGVYFLGSRRDQPWDGELLSALCISKISFGTWVEMGIGTAKILAAPESFRDAVACLRNREVQKLLRGFVCLRNAKFAHAYCRKESVFARNLGACVTNLQRLLSLCAFLEHLDLLVPLEYEEGKIIRADLYVGIHRRKDFSLPSPLLVGAKAQRLPEERAMLAFDRRSQEWVPLYPLWLWHYWTRRKHQDTYCLSAIDCDLEEQEVRLKSVKYLPYEEELVGDDQTSSWCSRGGDTDALAVKEILDSLKLSNRELLRKAEERDEPGELALLEQRQHLEWFVGREKTLGYWRKLLLERNGYLLLQDAPGKGKSAMIAKVAQMLREESIPVLLHMVKSQPSPRVFVPALVRQGLKCLREQGAPTAPDDKADDALREMLHRLVRHCGRAVLMIDGLDEIDDAGKDLGWLPRHLPGNASVLLTSRPDKRLLSALRARAGDVFTMPELPPLSPKDIDRLVEKRLTADKQEMFRRTSLWKSMYRFLGFPLGIVIAVKIMEDSDFWPEEKREDPGILDRSVNVQHQAIFAYWYDHASGRIAGGSQEKTKELRRKTLHLLAVSQATLGLYDLQKMLALENLNAGLEEIREAIEAIGQYLLEKGNDEFVLCHQSFAEYIRERIGEEETRRLHARFSEWLAGEAEKGREKGRENVCFSLSQSKQHARLVATLTDLSVCYQRIRAGQAKALRNDLEQAIQQLPPRYPGFARLQILAHAVSLFGLKTKPVLITFPDRRRYDFANPEVFWPWLHRSICADERKEELQDWLDRVEPMLDVVPESEADPGIAEEEAIFFGEGVLIPGNFQDMTFLEDSGNIALLHGAGIDTYDCENGNKIRQIPLETSTNPRKIFFDPECKEIILWRMDAKAKASESAEISYNCDQIYVLDEAGNERELPAYFRYYDAESRYIREIQVAPASSIWMSDGRVILETREWKYAIASMMILVFVLVLLLPRALCFFFSWSIEIKDLIHDSVFTAIGLSSIWSFSLLPNTSSPHAYPNKPNS